MTLLIVDQNKCKQDGLCAMDCPTGVIHFKGKGHFPGMVTGGDAICIQCGHCVTICPHGALDHSDVPLDQCPPIDKDLVLSEAQAEQFLRSRRSVRQFKKGQVDQGTLERLIEIARNAPTSKNGQLVEWVVINDREKLRRLCEGVIEWMKGLLKADPASTNMPYLPMVIKGWEAGKDGILRDAPCLIVAMSPALDNNGMVNLTLALSYLELAAPVFKLGTCWAGFLYSALLANPALRAEVGIADDFPDYYPMMIGNAKVRYQRLPVRKAPKIIWK